MPGLQKFYFIENFNKDHLKSLDSNTNVIYRNYKEKYDVSKIFNIKKFCKKIQRKFFLANDINLAVKLQLDGVYIPSFNKDKKHLSYSLKKKFIILGSAHNIYEIRTKETQNVNAIFLSSLFKKNKNFLGIHKFKLLTLLSKKPFVPLGGISNYNLKKLNLINARCFAGISFFEQKKGP